VLEGFARLGFRFMKADLEPGRIHGTNQQLPFFQEIEFYPPPQFAGRINEVELTFVTDPHGMTVVLEADKRGGLFTAGQDAFGRFQVSHQQAETMDWAAEISRWLDQVASRRASFMPGRSGHHGRGGMGGAAAGIAGGVAAGMILGEVFDEIGDAIFGDE
jgi:sporulation-control protein